ncbi:MAG: capsular biosynthesis protein [Sphingomonadales bacterium]|nr:capsular biosynthesis protein [Sphingomonadales bacterium]
MSNGRPQRQEFLFLQGPPGPFFYLLGQHLAQRGCGIHRINVCGGDRYDWLDGAVDFRGRSRDWPMFLDRFLRARGITDLVLFGDCRPLHQSALRLAKLRSVQVHVFEEGYIRPDWMTLERDGVNGHSSFERDPAVLVAGARWLPPIPDLPPITADFGRRARDSYWHYHHVVTGKLRFPHFRSHRQGSITVDGLAWGWRLLNAQRRAREAEAALQRIAGRPYYLFPLQLTGDYQIRAHSPFGSMQIAAEYVLESFANHAPADSLLLVKEHPLDSSWFSWKRFLAVQARRLGIADRVVHIDGGDLKQLSERSAGMVCVNSTSGTLALEAGTPVIVLGDAVYDVPGITHQAGLDPFWTAPEWPDAALWDAFKRSLHANCLVRGGLASESAIRTLVANSIERLLVNRPDGARALIAALQERGTRPASSR